MSNYVGRFAPSPSGTLHFGSLVAAVGSYLQARASGGRWLVRIEDLDPPREVPGAADEILRTLDRLGFEWDGPVAFQSERGEHYEAALERLAARGAIYECSCSRKDAVAQAAGESAPVYPGTCRDGARRSGVPTSIRVRTPSSVVAVSDALQGDCAQRLDRDVGDFVIRRRDGLFAYQLAVVVDDELQGVTEVVRGCDLLDSTPRQRLLQGLLKFNHPNYVHLPIAVDAAGHKLSKQNGAMPVSGTPPGVVLHAALEFLNQNPPPELRLEHGHERIGAWAVENWRLEPLKGLRSRAWTDASFACGCSGN